MIDINKYEGHAPAPWVVIDGELYQRGANGDYHLDLHYEPLAQLIADAPLLLAEVKRLHKQLEDCKRQIQFTADWIRDRGEDTHAKELDEFLEWME